MAHPIFTEEHDLIRAQLRRFVDERVKPEGPKWEQAGFVPREVLRQMGELGFFSLRVPEALGGAGLDARASVVLAEEVGRSTHGGFAITVLVHTDMASPHLIRFGNKRQLEKYLPGIMAGTIITAVGVTEPGAGSDVAGIRTRAVRDGNHYVLNGAKMFITNGVHGDLYFIAARTDPEAKGSRAITIFMVEKGTPGFRVGRALDKTGWRSSDTAELIFEDCRVPAENVLGEPNRGFYSIMANFQTERLVIGAMAMAEAREAIRLTFDYVNQRTAFGAPLVGKAGHSPAPVAPPGRGRGGAPARASHGLARCRGPGLRGPGLDGQGAGGRSGERGALRLRAVPRRHGLRARDSGRAHGARCPRAVDRRRRLRGHARGDRQAVRAGLVRVSVTPHLGRR